MSFDATIHRIGENHTSSHIHIVSTSVDIWPFCTERNRMRTFELLTHEVTEESLCGGVSSVSE